MVIAKNHTAILRCLNISKNVAFLDSDPTLRTGGCRSKPDSEIEDKLASFNLLCFIYLFFTKVHSMSLLKNTFGQKATSSQRHVTGQNSAPQNRINNKLK